MLGFNDKFSLELRLSEQKFSEQLMALIDTEFNKFSDLKSDPNKLYTGNIKFNKFNLSSAKTIFGKRIGEISGTYKIKNNNIVVKGQVVNYQFLLIFVTSYTLICLTLMVNFLFFNPTTDYAEFIFAFFSLIGISNYVGTIRKLNKLKDGFLDKMETFE